MGGDAFRSNVAASFVNETDGIVTGGDGGGAAYGSSYGGAGVNFTAGAAGTVDNSGQIAGGSYGGAQLSGGGGAGILASGALNLRNEAGATITGGANYAGSPYSGGAGVEVDGTDVATIANAGQITGGAGVAGAYGGAGITAAGDLSLDNVGSVTGGSTLDGNAGDGGAAVVAAGALTLNNRSGATIAGGYGFQRGGAGVSGGTGSYVYNAGSVKGGDGQSGGGYLGGGAGISVASNSAVVNIGSVYGGNSSAAAGGYGIYAGSGSYVSSSGTVRGGNSEASNGGNGILGVRAAGIVVDGGTVSGGDGGNTAGGSSYGGSGVLAAYGNLATTNATITGGNANMGGSGALVIYGSAAFNGGAITGGNSNADPSASRYGASSGFVGINASLASNATISGGMYGTTRGNAVSFIGGNNRLAIGSDAVFNGAVSIRTAPPFNGGLGSPAAGTLTFDQSAGSGFSNDATLAADLVGDGSVSKVGTGTLTLSGTANTFSGGTIIRAGTLDLAAAGAGGTGAISFRATGTAGTSRLILEMSAQNIGATFGSTLDSFGRNDSLDLRGFTFSESTTVVYDAAGHILSVSNGTNTQRFNLTNETPGANNMFYAQRDADGTGTLITNAPCYASGSRIRTVHGDVAVEVLAVGDLAVTASGEHRPIRWLGHRAIDCRHHPRPHEVLPVRVRAHAFGENRPVRDLVVSPGHSLCVDVLGEMLIPAMALINGSTIIQEDVDSITYWHVELDSHDVLLAENMPAESYLEMGNRVFFADNDVVDLEASPDAPVRTHADFCRPFHADGVLVDAVRAQLAARARRLGWRLEKTGLGDVHLVVDGMRVDARVRDLELCFPVPAGASRIWLVSGTASPHEIGDSPDVRKLGLAISHLVVDEGFSASRIIEHDDERLCVGFHPAEAEVRWTTGRALLPAELWAGTRDTFFLRAELHFPPLPRWVAPTVAQAGSANPGLNLVA